MGATAQQEAQSVVLEVAEPEAEALDVLDDEVRAFGGGVGEPGGVPAEDLGLPSADGLGEVGELDDVGRGAVRVERVEAAAGPAGSRVA
jgi:hypothetical protein